MSGSFNIPYQYPPMNYSGVTIQVANPTMNATPFAPHQACMPIPQQPHYCCPNHMSMPMQMQPQIPMNMAQQPVLAQPQANYPNTLPQAVPNYAQIAQAQPIPQYQNAMVNPETTGTNPSQTYPVQYYLNNYNYAQGQPQNGFTIAKSANDVPQEENAIKDNDTVAKIAKDLPNQNEQAVNKPLDNSFNMASADAVEQDLTTSKEIIENLDARVAEQKELEKNGVKTKVVALTNEYIMSLENYLNNPNSDIRLMASKEILTRFDEDRTRFDDAALNALLNKMLQDPEKLVRLAALSALSSQLASGNDFTVQLLHQIQQNPNSDKEDVLQVADILLKMSTQTEERYQEIPNTQAQAQPQEVIPQEAS